MKERKAFRQTVSVKIFPEKYGFMTRGETLLARMLRAELEERLPPKGKVSRLSSFPTTQKKSSWRATKRGKGTLQGALAKE
ncbi:MAG: hypothetical protein D6805_05435 [Planctomycetota bacterium]|nr:MAG: hypothetical protein D6805_05435 [Planctomycetota bacterium]